MARQSDRTLGRGLDVPLGGSIWWDCGDGDSGFEEFSEWEKLEARYQELFALFHGRDVLRDSFLKKDEEWVQVWPPRKIDAAIG